MYKSIKVFNQTCINGILQILQCFSSNIYLHTKKKYEKNRKKILYSRFSCNPNPNRNILSVLHSIPNSH